MGWIKPTPGATQAGSLSTEDFIPTVVELANPYDVTELVVTSRDKASISLSWKASVSTDTADYLIYNGTSLVATVTNTTVTITSLTGATVYTFTVKARDTDGNISYGASVTTNTFGLYMLAMPGTAGNYLTLTGVDFSSVEIDANFKTKAGSWNNHLITVVNNGSSANFEFGGTNMTAYGELTKLFVNGSQLPSAYNQPVPVNTRIKLKVASDTTFIDDLYLFARPGADPRNLAADIQHINLYRKDAFGVDYLVSEYDFTNVVAGSVPDSRGVSNPITIVGSGSSSILS